MNASDQNPSEPPPITVEEFDRMFDDGEDVMPYLDWENARWYPAGTFKLLPQPVQVELPAPLLAAVDREAERAGVGRQELVQRWVTERAQSLAAS